MRRASLEMQELLEHEKLHVLRAKPWASIVRAEEL